ncbi:MAG TPA: hypothetical protein VFT87_04225, partial [Candidatus Saccharimonadales bacterium]|nr:hypothetical protein [Candidatus Saccharimonadales bacterium]
YFALLLSMGIILGVSASGDYTSLGPVLGSTALGAALALGGTFGTLKLIDALALPGKNILGEAVIHKMRGAILLASIFLVMASVVMAWLSKPLHSMIATVV